MRGVKMSKDSLEGIDYEKIRKEYSIGGKITDAKKEKSDLILKIEGDSSKMYEMKVYFFFNEERSLEAECTIMNSSQERTIGMY
jgi:hypothetical protein